MFLYIWMCYLSFIANVPAYLRIWQRAYFRKRLWFCVTHWIYDFLCVRIFAFITLSLCECVTFSSVSVIAPLWERESVFIFSLCDWVLFSLCDSVTVYVLTSDCVIVWLHTILTIGQCVSDTVTECVSVFVSLCVWQGDWVHFWIYDCVTLCIWQGHRLRIWRWDSVALSIFSFDCINVLPFYFLSV